MMQLGYEVSLLKTTDFTQIAQRMSYRGVGKCAPSHVVMEIRADGSASQFEAYSNETYSSGSVGYYGRSGVFTTAQLVDDGLNLSLNNPTFSADFWRDYRDNEALISSLPVSRLWNDTGFFPPATPGCADGVNGCQNSCSKTAACTAREANNGECLVVVMLASWMDPGYIEAVFANLGIPAYFCFLGMANQSVYIKHAINNSIPVIFHHYQPELAHIRYENIYRRVQLPQTSPKLAALATGSFGEHGYGGATDNPVQVDFPLIRLEKYSSITIQSSSPIGSLLNRISISDLRLDEMMRLYIAAEASASPPPNLFFTAACEWLKTPSNYPTWRTWLDQLPDCTILQHIGYSLGGCDANGSDLAFPRVVSFHWNMPDPRNTSEPYNCDGAITSLPSPISTSRTCAWLRANYDTWITWPTDPPVCTKDHYAYNVTGCGADAKRLVQYYWRISDSENASLSSECVDGVDLPEPVILDCEYIPYETTVFKVITAWVVALCAVLLVCVVLVVKYRKLPVVKRSQYQFLITTLVGGMLMAVAVLMYAGPPSEGACVTRRHIVPYAFTLIFGSLIVKSLRVYRVFLSSAMKRVILSSKAMLKLLVGFLAVDTVLMLLWRELDPTYPTMRLAAVTTVTGAITVDYRVCKTGNFIFTALIIFWKAILLFVGLYMSFLIRKVSTDFQESTWIFASAVVVLFTSITVLMLAYLVEMKPMAFFLFFAFMLLTSTTIVMGLMLVPKMIKARRAVSDQSHASDSSRSSASSDSNASTSERQPAAPVSRDKAQPSKKPPISLPVIPFKRAASSSTKVQVQPAVAATEASRPKTRRSTKEPKRGRHSDSMATSPKPS